MLTAVDRFWKKTQPGPNECVEWTAANDGAYGLFRAGGRTRRAHRWIFEHLNGPTASGLVIRHRCDNSLCVNPEHLEPGTVKDNAQDRTRRGRWIQRIARGQDHGHATLTDDKVRTLRRMYSWGVYSQACLAEAFGVSQMTTSRAIRGKTWSHVS